ncbi:hypothetical protein Q5752_004789 [Cryptotrichosporon argae]
MLLSIAIVALTLGLPTVPVSGCPPAPSPLPLADGFMSPPRSAPRAGRTYAPAAAALDDSDTASSSGFDSEPEPELELAHPAPVRPAWAARNGSSVAATLTLTLAAATSPSPSIMTSTSPTSLSTTTSAPATTSTSASASTSAAASASLAQRKPTLHRFGACVACRDRKLRCDAGKPVCGPCLKRHNNERVSASAATHPCIYDATTRSDAASEAKRFKERERKRLKRLQRSEERHAAAAAGTSERARVPAPARARPADLDAAAAEARADKRRRVAPVPEGRLAPVKPPKARRHASDGDAHVAVAMRRDPRRRRTVNGSVAGTGSAAGAPVPAAAVMDASMTWPTGSPSELIARTNASFAFGAALPGAFEFDFASGAGPGPQTDAYRLAQQNARTALAGPHGAFRPGMPACVPAPAPAWPGAAPAAPVAAYHAARCPAPALLDSPGSIASLPPPDTPPPPEMPLMPIITDDVVALAAAAMPGMLVGPAAAMYMPDPYGLLVAGGSIGPSTSVVDGYAYADAAGLRMRLSVDGIAPLPAYAPPLACAPWASADDCHAHGHVHACPRTGDGAQCVPGPPGRFGPTLVECDGCSDGLRATPGYAEQPYIAATPVGAGTADAADDIERAAELFYVELDDLVRLMAAESETAPDTDAAAQAHLAAV